mgnify:CR=1 FL=1
MVESVRRLPRGEISTLNVGYVSNLFYDLLPATLASLKKLLPTVSINLFDMSCGDQFRAIEARKIDLGFVGLHEPIEMRGLQFQTIASYLTEVALPKSHPLARKATVNLKDLAPMFFIGMSERSYPSYRDWLTKTCRSVGFTPRVLQDVEVERTMIHAVAGGLGVALVPEPIKNSSTRMWRFAHSTLPSERKAASLGMAKRVACAESIFADHRPGGPQYSLISRQHAPVWSAAPVHMVPEPQRLTL